MAQRRDRLETAGANVGSGGGKPNSPLELAAERDTTTGKDSAAAGILKGAPSGSTSGQLRDLPASSKLRRQPPQTEQQREEEEAGPLASGQELQGDVGEDIGMEPPLQEREPMKAYSISGYHVGSFQGGTRGGGEEGGGGEGGGLGEAKEKGGEGKEGEGKGYHPLRGEVLRGSRTSRDFRVGAGEEQ